MDAVWRLESSCSSPELAAGKRSHNQKWLAPRGDRVRQRRIRRLGREGFPAREEPYHRTTPEREVIADRATEHGVRVFQGVEDRALGDRAIDGEADLAREAGEGPEVEGQDDADHGRVWTST